MPKRVCMCVRWCACVCVCVRFRARAVSYFSSLILLFLFLSSCVLDRRNDGHVDDVFVWS